ncbi:MAG: hypothetical protein JSS61_06095 [Verrucomicrobia bacterium]|nr:hypothetical protein [Verrucomicrobiota bacterium]
MSTAYQTGTRTRTDPVSFALSEFKYITRQYALFHIGFFALAILELLAFVLFFSFFTQTTIFAFSLAGLFLTAFTYFVLLFYLQAKKPQQLLEVRNAFIKRAGDGHLIQALEHLLASLHHLEYTYYSVPPHFQTLSYLLQKFSAWSHWKDLHDMKESLHYLLIKEHIEQVKRAPTDLETHANLASAFRALSHHYMDPQKREPTREHIFISPEYASPIMQEKFEKAALRAIEEFKILDSYAPSDPWVHAQMASIYHDLEKPLEEMRQYEAILQVTPQDPEALFRLGILSFKQGYNAQALRLYEKLKSIHPSKAEELITYYGLSLE